MPVLIYERIKTREYFHIIKRYRRKLIFAGKLTVPEVFLMGLNGYLYLSGTKYRSTILQGLLSLLATTKLDDEGYRITDWFEKKGQLILYIVNEA